MDSHCPTCGSSAPHMHPAIQHEGEVQVCADSFHLTPTPQNRPEYINAVRRLQAKTCRQCGLRYTGTDEQFCCDYCKGAWERATDQVEQQSP
jgi:hypothetical protein